MAVGHLIQRLLAQRRAQMGQTYGGAGPAFRAGVSPGYQDFMQRYATPNVTMAGGGPQPIPQELGFQYADPGHTGFRSRLASLMALQQGQRRSPGTLPLATMPAGGPPARDVDWRTRGTVYDPSVDPYAQDPYQRPGPRTPPAPGPWGTFGRGFGMAMGRGMGALRQQMMMQRRQAMQARGKTQPPGRRIAGTTGPRYGGNIGGTKRRTRNQPSGPIKGGLLSRSPTQTAVKGAFEGMFR